MAVELVGEQLGDAHRRLGGRKRQDSAAIMVEREADVAARHREALHGIEAGRIFGTRAAQELAARGHLVEQALDPDASAGRKRSRPLPRRLPVIHLDSPAVRPASPAFERQPRDACDRWQGLAPEAEARNLIDRLARQLGGRVPLERQAHLVRRHSGPVVGHFDQLQPARAQPDGDLIRAGVE